MATYRSALLLHSVWFFHLITLFIHLATRLRILLLPFPSISLSAYLFPLFQVFSPLRISSHRAFFSLVFYFSALYVLNFVKRHDLQAVRLNLQCTDLFHSLTTLHFARLLPAIPSQPVRTLCDHLHGRFLVLFLLLLLRLPLLYLVDISHCGLKRMMKCSILVFRILNLSFVVQRTFLSI